MLNKLFDENYQTRELAGEGGFASVYKVTQGESQIAIKETIVEVSENSSSEIKKFLEEPQLLERSQQSNEFFVKEFWFEVELGAELLTSPLSELFPNIIQIDNKKIKY